MQGVLIKNEESSKGFLSGAGSKPVVWKKSKNKALFSAEDDDDDDGGE